MRCAAAKGRVTQPRCFRGCVRGVVRIHIAVNTHVEVFDPARGSFQSVDDIAAQAAQWIHITARHGERLIITVAQRDVDPGSPVTISFNKRMFVGAATDDTSVTTFLKTFISVNTDDELPRQEKP